MAVPVAITARLLVTGAAAACTAAIGFAQPAQADSVGYLVSVTLRPGYNFPNADAALSHGYGLCDQIGSGVRYGQLVNHQVGLRHRRRVPASYLISQPPRSCAPPRSGSYGSPRPVTPLPQ